MNTPDTNCGPGARTLQPEWVMPIRDQCAEQGVPFFFKQVRPKASASLRRISSSRIRAAALKAEIAAADDVARLVTKEDV